MLVNTLGSFLEGTTVADIAQATGGTEVNRKKDCDCDCEGKRKHKGKELQESPVGMVGRTGHVDATAHVSDALRKRFRKIIQELGGKTVARLLIAEMNPVKPSDQLGEGMASDKIETQLYSLQKYLTPQSKIAKNVIMELGTGYKKDFNEMAEKLKDIIFMYEEIKADMEKAGNDI